MTNTHSIDTLPAAPMTPSAHDLRRHDAMAAFELACASGDRGAERLDLLKAAMLATPHGPASNTLEHGIDTWRHYRAICEAITAGDVPDHWPAWLTTHGRALLARQVDLATMERYLTFHDCGKAWALTWDTDGRAHYPEHAERSSEIWALAGGSPKECELMRKDMVLHTVGAEEAAVFGSDPLAPSLLFAAFAELQSNAASIFGGLDSTSYKIKIKALTRRAKAITASYCQDAAAPV